MKTIAQQLNITSFPFIIKDKNGKEIYHEYSDGHWAKYKYDSNGNQTYHEDSTFGVITDDRPKTTFTIKEIAEKLEKLEKLVVALETLQIKD